jgi:altronate hydrolase
MTNKTEIMEPKIFLQMDSRDNVLVALKDLKKGTRIESGGKSIVLQDDIPVKHKFFTTDIKKGGDIIMYGHLVGKAQEDVGTGTWMNVTNVKHAAEPYAYRKTDFHWQAPDISRYRDQTFNGYHRGDGRVGTANYWLFIPAVFCENRNLAVIREALDNELGYSVTDKYKRYTRSLTNAYLEGIDIGAADIDFTLSKQADGKPDRVFKNIDGVKFLTHEGGCGGTRQDSALLNSLLVAYADHPNVGGVTLLSLGCQHLQIDDFKREIQKRNPSFNKPFLIFEQQQADSEEALIRQAIYQTFLGLTELNKIERKPAPLNKLCIGVKCGGSDGFSGISANPAVGYAADMLVALGGKVLLAEFPELCGAEQELINRCTAEASARKFIELMQSYNELAHQAGSGFHMNPSPGNIRDGLITDAIKSAGAVKKGGTSPVTDVLDYTEPATREGLSLVCTPGNDVEATTGKVASGATLILFTTGLGTPTGNPICPTIKISSNTRLAQRMKDIIDIDAGTIITGEESIQQVGTRILDFCIRVAGGEVIPKTVGLHQDDFIPWKKGVSL